MKADDIADLRPLNPCPALRLPTERRVVRLNKMVAGDIGLPRERVRCALSLLTYLGNGYFEENPELNHDLRWIACAYEQTDRCERAGSALFIAYANGRAMSETLKKKVAIGLVDQVAAIYQHALETFPGATLPLPLGPAAARNAAGIDGATVHDERDRGVALLISAALHGTLTVWPYGEKPWNIDLPNAQAVRGRSFNGSVQVEGNVDGLHWHDLWFSVHGLPVTERTAISDVSGKRFFPGRVGAEIYHKLLIHFMQRDICLFELYEFVDPALGPGKNSTHEIASFRFLRKADAGLFSE